MLGARGASGAPGPAAGRSPRAPPAERGRVRAGLLRGPEARRGAALAERHLRRGGDRLHRGRRDAGGDRHRGGRGGQPALARPPAVGPPRDPRRGLRRAPGRGAALRARPRSGGNGRDPLHLGDDRATQGRDAEPRQRRLERACHRPSPADDAGGPRPLRGADVPLLRPELHHERAGRGGRAPRAPPALRPRRVSGRDRGASHHAVLRRADDVHPVPLALEDARLRLDSALLLGGGAAAGGRRAPLARALRAAHHAGLRPHRVLALRRLEPRRHGAPGLGRDADRERRDAGRGRRGAPGGRRAARRDPHQGPQRHEGLLRQRGGHGAVAPERLASLGRRRLSRRRRLLLPRGPREGHDQRRRLQGVPARGRGGPLPPRGGEGGGGRRCARPGAGRGGEGLRRPAGGPVGERRRAPEALP